VSQLLTNEQAAQFLGVSAGTLPIWRCKRKYALPFVRVGRLIRYERSALQSWIEKRTESGAASKPPKRRARGTRRGGAR